YFTDLFTHDHGLRFGHTTEKGHSLIAENLMKEFLLNWKTIEKRKDQRSQTVEKAAHYDSSP
ncbi:MAG: hypothetical protein RBT63_06455, partial [Bdellovibrionales bacterium]|nr:hypothetical protein [Bdellovibrionales bacterium]